MTQQAIIEAALALPESERMALVTPLLESLGSETDGLDEDAFVRELRRRTAEIDQGTAGLVSWDELRKENF
jgi:putative addiction module component (TIGR02574 family)